MQLYKNFTPIVSVILPTFNRADYIKRAIDSVITQTYNQWELIIIDDGSTDETFSVVESYINDFGNVRYMKHKNRKLPISLNVGIQASAGEYITFLGSDDEYKSDHLELRLNYLLRNTNTDLVHGGIEVIGNPFVKDKNDLSKKVHLSKCIIGGTFFGKRKVFTELDGFKNLNYSEDSEFLERAEKKFVIQKIDFPTYLYHRETEGSITNSI